MQAPPGLTGWRHLRLAAGVGAMLLGLAGSALAQGGMGLGLLGDGMDDAATATTPQGVRPLLDVPYGSDRRQRMDIYLPPQPRGAPVLVMVHGGAWMVGDKRMAPVVDNKVAHWVQARGWVFVSVNYRMWPQADPVAQARDVAQALAAVQAQAAGWGADPARLLLMGHSAGAHLVALLGANPERARSWGLAPWAGTVALDSAAIDLLPLMQRRHARFYDRVFGADPAYWRAASPTDTLAPGAPPLLLVCSPQRSDGSCQQSQAFADRAHAVGVRAELLPQDLNHRGVNEQLGLEGSAYTAAVDTFAASLGLR